MSLNKYQPNILDDKGQVPGPGDDIAPKNVIAPNDRRVAIGNVALVSAGDKEEFSAHQIDAIDIHYNAKEEIMQVVVKAKNLNETRAIHCSLAKPCEVVGHVDLKMTDLTDGKEFESDTQVLLNQDAEKLFEALKNSKEHTGAMNVMTDECVMQKADKVPKNTGLEFRFEIIWKTAVKWMKGFGNRIEDGSPYEICDFQLLLPQPLTGWFDLEPVPIKIKITPPSDAVFTLPDAVAANHELPRDAVHMWCDVPTSWSSMRSRSVSHSHCQRHTSRRVLSAR